MPRFGPSTCTSPKDGGREPWSGETTGGRLVSRWGRSMEARCSACGVAVGSTGDVDLEPDTSTGSWGIFGWGGGQTSTPRLCEACLAGEDARASAASPVRTHEDVTQRAAPEDMEHHIGIVHAEYIRESAHQDRCAGCGFTIEDVAVKAMGALWHRECFQCAVCGVALFMNDRDSTDFHQIRHLPLCEKHFEEQMEALGGEDDTALLDSSEDEDDEVGVLGDHGMLQATHSSQASDDTASFTTAQSMTSHGLASPISSPISRPLHQHAMPPPAPHSAEHPTEPGAENGKPAVSFAGVASPHAPSSSWPPWSPLGSGPLLGSTGLDAAEYITTPEESVPGQRSRSGSLKGNDRRLKRTASRETAAEAGERMKQHHHKAKSASLYHLGDLLQEAMREEEEEEGVARQAKAAAVVATVSVIPEVSGARPVHEPPVAVKATSSKQQVLPPLTNGTALSYGIQLAAQMPKEVEPLEPDDRFRARRHLQLLYSGSLFYWEETAPEVFTEVRKMFGVSRRQYLASMVELSGAQKGEGKSRSLFFRSQDGLLVIKTISEGEQQCLCRLLASYYEMVKVRKASTLLPRFFGCYSVKLPGSPVCRVIVMNNVFREVPPIVLKQRYDIKGSVLKRFVTDADLLEQQVTTLKDLNFCGRHDGTDDYGLEVKACAGPCRVLCLGASRKAELMDSLGHDVEWLRQGNIMDYSLLIGICSVSSREKGLLEALEGLPRGLREEDRHRLYSLWAPAHEAEGGGRSSDVFLMGFVDILQEYNLKKKLETFYKTGVYWSEGRDPKGISVVDPGCYGKRFLAFMEQHLA